MEAEDASSAVASQQTATLDRTQKKLLHQKPVGQEPAPKVARVDSGSAILQTAAASSSAVVIATPHGASAAPSSQHLTKMLPSFQLKELLQRTINPHATIGITSAQAELATSTKE